VTGGNLRPSARSGGQPPPVPDAGLQSAAEELYALSPADFTAARNERVAQERTSGNRELARAIGALRRPTVSAWLVNQLVRESGDQVGDLLALGESLRQAHEDLAGEQVRELSAQRRRLVTALVAEAKRLAERDGRAIGLEVEREVEATLQAALADADAAAAVRAGRLDSPLSYAGLGMGDEAGVVSWHRAPARERAPSDEKAPAQRKAPVRKKGPEPERASGRRAKETAAEREARLAAEEREREAGRAAAEAERRAAKVAEAEQAVRRAADAVAAAAADLAQAEAKFTAARAAQESARQQVERLDKELSRAITAESQANRTARDAQRSKEAAARAAEEANRRLARAQAAARRVG
jgi:hypothetical protein